MSVRIGLAMSFASVMKIIVTGRGNIWHLVASNPISHSGTALAKANGASIDPYRPERYYKRGPGPKWRAKHGFSVSFAVRVAFAVHSRDASRGFQIGAVPELLQENRRATPNI